MKLKRISFWRDILRHGRATSPCPETFFEEAIDIPAQYQKPKLPSKARQQKEVAGHTVQIKDTNSTSSEKNGVVCTLRKQKPEKKVEFCDVHVRTYSLILGDNPSIEFPLSLGWSYRCDGKIAVNDFEKQKRSRYLILKGQSSPGGGGRCFEERAVEENTQESENEIQPLDIRERRIRFRSVGYSEAALRARERQRRIQLGIEWAHGKDLKNDPYKYSFKFIEDYVLT